MTRREATFALAAATAAAVPGAAAGMRTVHGTQAAADEQRFEGAWSMTGSRHTVPTELGREAAILHLSGSVVLTGAGRLGRGFHGEFIGYDDAGDRRAGRWVWTDDRGDRIYGELSGEPMATGRRFTAIITGGSGRYSGITGDFAFTWQYVVSPESGVIAGRTTGLQGLARFGRPSR